MPKANLRGESSKPFKKREPMTHADKDYNKRHDPQVQQDWIDRCKDSILSAWEMDFIDSIENQIQCGRTLSEKQIKILERIYVDKA